MAPSRAVGSGGWGWVVRLVCFGDAQGDPKRLAEDVQVGAGDVDGWADVWRRGCFAWEYKGKHRDLTQAMSQVRNCAGALGNPPFLIVSDIERIVVQTNWTNTVSQTRTVQLGDLLQPPIRTWLKRVFQGDESLRTAETRAALTEKAAKQFAELARELKEAGHAPLQVAHFVIRLAFCMFAEDAGLLRDGAFGKLLDHSRVHPEQFLELASELFRAMSQGGRIGYDSIEWFNGGLFDDDSALPLTRHQIDRLRTAAALDRSSIDPSLLGTLFVRGLDPEQRSALGAHYTDPANIMRIVEPVVLRPLRDECQKVQDEIAGYKAPRKRRERLNEFLQRLRGVRVLDPACGSGNFLYMALRGLKDLELEVVIEAEALGLERPFTEISPEVLLGIDLNPYAAELARASIWIGEIQWQLEHGYSVERKPILKPLNTIECRDALLNEDGSIAEWPTAEFIVGNPPFLGDKLMRAKLGDSYTDRLRSAHEGKVPGGADFVTYWFYRAGQALQSASAKRVGLVATNNLRKGASNRVLRAALGEHSRIFEAWSDLPWVLDGAAVRVSLACFGRSETLGPEERHLDGARVVEVIPNLTGVAAGLQVTLDRRGRWRITSGNRSTD